MSTRVRSFSKINLGLAVGPARADGFHGLTTAYQTLALHDLVTVSARRAAKTVIRLSADHVGVPSTAQGNAERNTAWKIVAGALARLGITAEVEIEIEKRLPVQGGMGAGSANAVAALLGLERELGVALSGTERLKLAAGVGSDVPLFLLGGTVLGLGRGEEVYPLPESPTMHCVVAVPGVGVSTALAFRELDARIAGAVPPGLKPLGSEGRLDVRAEARTLQSEKNSVMLAGEAYTLQSEENATVQARGALQTTQALTFQQGEGRLKELSYALAAVWTQNGVEAGPSGIARPVGFGHGGDLAENPLLTLVRTGIENDFEEVVFSQHPSLRSTKRDLLGSSGDSGEGCVYAALSGSGSALFGLYETRTAAEAAQQRVQANGTRAILTETLPRREYWQTMFA
jgi:4-diphosphocytidyl-2-C-methyl-D-erythritol kinase